jgi:membrane protein
VSSRVRPLVAQAKLRVERARARYGAVDVLLGTFKRYSADDGGSYAAALTYYVFFSIFPLLAFALALLGYITFGNSELQREIFDAGLKAAPMLRSALSKKGLSAIAERRRELALTGAALALYSGSGAVVALEHALNKIWHVTHEPGLVAKRVRSLKWLAVLGIAAVASVALGAGAELAGSIFGSLAPAGATVASLLIHLVGVIVGVGVFASAFKLLPAVEVSWHDVVPGAVAAAVCFELLKVVGSVYFEAGSKGRNATFGAFATSAGLLVVSYLLAQVTLLCAELNATLVERRFTRQSLNLQPQGGSQ